MTRRRNPQSPSSPKKPQRPADESFDEQAKDRQLDSFREDPEGAKLTTNQGVALNHTDDSLKAGSRGPTLMEDFHFREKLTHFDHERIPERVVHARGAGAHGTFQCLDSFAELTRASFLQDPSVKTPVFVRFSTVVGSRGSADTVRDARGFATKFYTEEGVFDLVGNNIPVFFIQDGIKFPDLVHSIKPEPDSEMPQASAAHDTFWDFISLTPESLHMIMWVLSDRALPRSYRMMEGFGVHTFRFVNAQGVGRFVKFHWRPALGSHSLVWDEAQKLAGKEPDYNRRDLWEAIASGAYPEYVLAAQIVEEHEADRFDFDLLDPTKIIPEELVPLTPLGKMVLDRNPDNFFAETEQVAFHPGHVVPGIDFTNDPLLQGRLFSYLDTQLLRLGGPNFAELPINRPLAPVHNNQRDGFGRQTINRGRASYSPNTLGGGCPMTVAAAQGGYVHYTERVEGHKVRERSPSFQEHYAQATLFWNSQSAAEQQRLVEAAQFELGKVSEPAIRERMVAHFNEVDHDFAVRVAAGVGVAKPGRPQRKNHGQRSAALSIARPAPSIASRKVAILAADGVSAPQIEALKRALAERGAVTDVVSQRLGKLASEGRGEVTADETFTTTASVVYDALFVPGGEHVATLSASGDALHFVAETFRHGKPIAAVGAAVELLAEARVQGVALAQNNGKVVDSHGVVSTRDAEHLQEVIDRFASAIQQHRHWGREKAMSVPA
jgi:catalase